MADETTAIIDSGTKIEDVRPEDFVLSDFVQEIATLIQERQAFLNSKVERRTIGGPEKNLAQFRLIRMRALHEYLVRIQAHQAGKVIDHEVTPAPAIESPLKDFVQEIEAEAAAETGRFDFSKLKRPGGGRVEEFEQHQDEVVQPEPETPAPQEPESGRHDDWD